jgi:hypothetical protein
VNTSRGLITETPEALHADHLARYGRVLQWGETIPGTTIPFHWGEVDVPAEWLKEQEEVA